MAELSHLEAFLKLLTLELGDNAKLRDTLVDTLFVFLEEQRRERGQKPQSYLELLDQVEEQRRQLDHVKKQKLRDNLNVLGQQIRGELRETALALHHTLRSSNKKPPEHLLKQLGVDLTGFPAGFPQELDLLKLSRSYITDNSDLVFLRRNFPDTFPVLAQTLTQHQHRAVQALHTVVSGALLTGTFVAPHLLAFQQQYQKIRQRLQHEAGQEVSALLRFLNGQLSVEALQEVETWFHRFDMVAAQVVKELSPAHKEKLLNVVIRSRDWTVLQTLPVFEPQGRQRARFETLMTLRFGQAFQKRASNWKSWFTQHIEQKTRRKEAVLFWQKQHPFIIPTVLREFFENSHPDILHRKGVFGIPEPLLLKMEERMETGNVAELLERRSSIMTAREIHLLEEEIQKLAISATGPECDLQEASSLEKEQHGMTPEIEQGEPPASESESPSLVESALDTAVDAAIEGNLAEAAVISVLDKGASMADVRLSVTIEEDEESNVKANVPQQSVEPEEAEESLWTDYIFPFVRQNLVFVLAPGLIFIGLLLLVFTLWDKAAWIRYGLTPFMLVGVSYFLSRIGLWLKGQDIHSETPIVTMQTVSIFLAPMSLLFVALLSFDQELSLMLRIASGVGLAGALLAAWFYVFNLAIQSVSRTMTVPHSGTLLLLNALLLLLPVAQFIMASESEHALFASKALLVGGFYLSFLVLCGSMSSVLGKMLEEGTSGNRIPMLFYSITCLGTFIFVWALTHTRLLILPQPHTYGPLLLLFSFLLSMVEFKLLDIRFPSWEGQGVGTSARITSLSYSAYFFIGLGSILSMGHDDVRVIALLLAGLVWFYQAMKLTRLTSLTPPCPPQGGNVVVGNDLNPHGIESRNGTCPPQGGNVVVGKDVQSPLEGGRGVSSQEGNYAARHYNISMVLLIAGFSSIALVRDFPAPFFPYLTLVVVLGLYLVSVSFALKEVAMLAFSLSPIYLSFAFVVSVLWQWGGEYAPLSYGVAFVGFALFSLFLGMKTNRLIHVHAGAFYAVAALPYLGSVDMSLYTLQGNTLVFGLALVGIVWTLISSTSQIPAFQDSRSTVLWNIGILAFCVMCLRLILNDSFDFSAHPILQFQLLSGPVLIAGLMLLTGFFTRSYAPVYLALVVLVIIFPEIKNRFDIPMYSGLGSTMSGIGFLSLAFGLSFVPFLKETHPVDLIWRKNAFPAQAKNSYLLFANPIMVAAFFLFTRTIFYTYPVNYFKPLQPFSIKTLIAVLLCGTAYHVLSVWFRKSIFSYIGFAAIAVSIIHSCYLDNAGVVFDERFLPLFILAAFVYWQSVCRSGNQLVRVQHIRYIFTPYRHLRMLVFWIAALGGYVFYSFVYAASSSYIVWLPLLGYWCGIVVWLAWKAAVIHDAGTPSTPLRRGMPALRPAFHLIPAYLLLWQIVTLLATSGSSLPYVLDPARHFYLSTALMALVLVSSFFGFELLLSKTRFRAFSSVLWCSFVLLLMFSLLVTLAFYLIPSETAFLSAQIVIWAVVSFLLGRFLNLGPLWLWSAFLLHLLFLPSVKGATNFYLSFHPFTLACIAIALSVFSLLSVKITWLYEYRYCYPRAKSRLFSPSVLFAAAAHIVSVLVFLQAVNPDYRHDWMTVVGLFLAAVPALFAAHQIGLSRHLLFGVPYTLAWVGLTLALKANFPDNAWLLNLSMAQMIALGLFGAMLTSVVSDFWLPSQAPGYRRLKLLLSTVGIGLVIFAYCSIRNVELLTWQWLLTSGIITIGMGIHCRFEKIFF